MRFFVFIAALIFCTITQAQNVEFELNNGSFEDIRAHSITPSGWLDCAVKSFPLESPPDVQPNGEWGVYRPPYHGVSYLGMVARENDSWESVGQSLAQPLEPGNCYYFGVYLCRSLKYQSAVRTDAGEYDNTLKNFTQPIKLRIWGGTDYCTKTELLAESEEVENVDWKLNHFKFQPKNTITHIILEAFYVTPTLFPYNGNILLDKASAISRIPCDQERPEVIPPIVEFLQPIEKVDQESNLMLVKGRIRYVESASRVRFVVNSKPVNAFRFDPSNGRFEAKVNMEEGKNILYLQAANEGGVDSDQTSVYIQNNLDEVVKEIKETNPAPEQIDPPTEYKILRSLNNKNFTIGQTIKIDKLYFPADSATITVTSKPVLDEIYTFLDENDQFIIEIGGHTSAWHEKITHEYCDSLSLARAKAVAEYLYGKGIPEDRISFKGYGKRRPVASNQTLEGRKKNQRVEIKILSMG